MWNALDPNCPTRSLLDRIGDKWTVLILVALERSPLRFGELGRAIGGVTPKVLTAKLRALEQDGLISRQVLDTSPVNVEYKLTELGQSLVSVVFLMKGWAEKNMPAVLSAREAFEQRMKKRIGVA